MTSQIFYPDKAIPKVLAYAQRRLQLRGKIPEAAKRPKHLVYDEPGRQTFRFPGTRASHHKRTILAINYGWTDGKQHHASPAVIDIAAGQYECYIRHETPAEMAERHTTRAGLLIDFHQGRTLLVMPDAGAEITAKYQMILAEGLDAALGYKDIDSLDGIRIAPLSPPGARP